MNVRLFVRGGLGNQLFQLAGGLLVRARTGGGRLTVDTTLHNTGLPAGHAASPRFFEIGPVVNAVGGRVAAFPFSTRVELYRPLINRATRPHGQRILGRTSFLTADNIARPVVDSVQDELWEGICRAGVLPTPRPRITQGVHLRLGDYRALEHLYGAPSWSYYEQALEAAFGRDHPVVVFSDEEELALSWFQEKKSGFEFVAASHHRDGALSADMPEPDTGVAAAAIRESSWGTLAQMAACERLVAGNSTFSWWAAWFALRSPGAVVVAPSVLPVTGLQAPAGASTADWT